MNGRTIWIPLITVIAALALEVWPLPGNLEPFWPTWLALVVIYWCMALPQRFGIAMSWLCGLLADALTGAVLGQHALALTLVAFIILKWHLQIRMFPIWQQSLVVGLILLAYELTLYWIHGITGHAVPLLWQLAALPASILLWPWLANLLRLMRRRYQLA